mmetsp:Transcript_15506/g.44897  ORF Transcript_15506/g.44897 Transcript_15506/m.44897 type:complete len:237 (+) Transcript_15506:39-749(+)
MSSGALLLKQLQARQREQAASHSRVDRRQNSNGADSDTSRAGNEEGSADDAVQSAGSTGDTDKALRSRHVEGGIGNGDKSVTIEVCLGPDCSGGGGGAALLEIEALVMGSSGDASTLSLCEPSAGSRSTSVCVVGGGCRDYCTMGPNVHIRSASIVAKESHLTKVNCPAECRRVVRAAMGGTRIAHDTPDEDDGTADVENILQLRKDGQRWRGLREQAAKERRLRVRERELKKDGS